MSQSPSLNPNRQFGFLQSSSTPLFLQNSSPQRFKSSSYKQINHSKLRNQSSPYSLATHYQHQSTANVLFNYQHCDDSESELTSQDTSISSLTKTNPPTTPISSLIPTSTESSPSIVTKTELLHVTPASNSVDSSRPISSDITSYSRSSSYTSLSSFEIKSTHSSLQSDYSNQPTSACYTDLPNSPGDAPMLQQQSFRFNYSMGESNPSRSNEITIVEKTVVENCSKSGLDTLDEDEQCVTYDMEGSISGRSVKSNVSHLTFNEPTTDLTFIRNLLETKKMSADKRGFSQPAWSNLYTPPVKLTDTIPKILTEPQVSKTLFPDFRNDFFCVQTPSEDDKDSIKFFNDEEDRESCTSKASVPSIIRDEMECNAINKVHLNKLFEKISSANSSLLDKTAVNETTVTEEEDDQKILFEFIDECFSKKNQHEEEQDEKLLPKIDEEENENEASFSEKKVRKTVPVVQMTKTAMLRANKLKETQAKQQQQPTVSKKPKVEEKKLVRPASQPSMGSMNKPPTTFKFMNPTQSSQAHVSKKPNQVLASINNNWH